MILNFATDVSLSPIVRFPVRFPAKNNAAKILEGMHLHSFMTLEFQLKTEIAMPSLFGNPLRKHLFVTCC